MTTPETSQSLLDRARDSADSASWRRLIDIYTPLIRRWVRRSVDQPADADDLVQEVLVALVRELPRFQHNQRPGAFRAWLRAIALNRLRAYWQTRRTHPPATSDLDVQAVLDRLEDPESALSRSWDEEHDQHVAETLLETIRLEFQPATWRAFELLVREGETTAEVASDLGISVNAALIAKSRVLKRLRQKAAGLID